MTEKQKEAIKVLNRLRETGFLSEDEYFAIFEFVVLFKPEIQYVPYTPNPLDHLPFYGQGQKTTCNETLNDERT